MLVLREGIRVGVSLEGVSPPQDTIRDRAIECTGRRGVLRLPVAESFVKKPFTSSSQSRFDLVAQRGVLLSISRSSLAACLPFPSSSGRLCERHLHLRQHRSNRICPDWHPLAHYRCPPDFRPARWRPGPHAFPR